MKKLSTLLTGTLATAVLASCAANSESKTDSASDSTPMAETAVIIEAEEEAPQTSSPTPDLAFAEVTGNVKSVKMNEQVLKFDAEGHLTAGLPQLKRDKEGRILEWGYDEYSLTWENGRPKTLKTRESDGGEILTTYVYDADGRLIKATSHYDLPGDDPWDVTLSYSYPEGSIDAQGNWTVRNVNGAESGPYREKRSITYF